MIIQEAYPCFKSYYDHLSEMDTIPIVSTFYSGPVRMALSAIEFVVATFFFFLSLVFCNCDPSEAPADNRYCIAMGVSFAHFEIGIVALIPFGIDCLRAQEPTRTPEETKRSSLRKELSKLLEKIDQDGLIRNGILADRLEQLYHIQNKFDTLNQLLRQRIKDLGQKSVPQAEWGTPQQSPPSTYMNENEEILSTPLSLSPSLSTEQKEIVFKKEAGKNIFEEFTILLKTYPEINVSTSTSSTELEDLIQRLTLHHDHYMQALELVAESLAFDRTQMEKKIIGINHQIAELSQ